MCSDLYLFNTYNMIVLVAVILESRMKFVPFSFKTLRSYCSSGFSVRFI